MYLICDVILVSGAQHCEIYIFIFIYIKVLYNLLSNDAVFKYNVLLYVFQLLKCVLLLKESYDQPTAY